MSIISLSKNYNSNYLAKIIKLNKIEKHPNADRLQVTSVDFQSVILGNNAKVGDLYVFFPLECQINPEFLSSTNSYRDKELNKDKEAQGFFEKNGRVRAVKLRGEKSMGYVVPLKQLEDYADGSLHEFLNEEFDTINGTWFVKKYIVKEKQIVKQKKGKNPKISRLVEGQVHLHIDTDNLRKNIYKINPDDEISISYKVHGTSFWVSNVLVKKPLNIFEKFIRLLKFPVKYKTEYDIVYGSRRVVKNEHETNKKDHFYGYDLWSDIKEELKEFIPKGYSIYGECCGYTKQGGEIQKGYNYGCSEGNHKLYIYRITFTNSDGVVNNLSTSQIEEFCNHFRISHVPVFYKGKAKDVFPDIPISEHWKENFIKKLEQKYNEKDCYICDNKVPEEGIVIRKESMFYFEAYKLKSFKFLEHETKLLDKGEENIEDNQ